MSDTKGLTVSEFRKYYRKDKNGKGHISFDGANDILFDEIVCDICNAEILQPEGEPDKKVVFVDEKNAYCERCKDDDKGKEKLDFLAEEVRQLSGERHFLQNRGSVASGKKMMVDSIKSENIKKYVHSIMYQGIRNGWLIFKDSVKLTADQWSLLSDDEKENYPVAITEKGKREGGDFTKLMAIKDEYMKNESGLFQQLVSGIDFDKGKSIIVRLTKDGELMRKFYETTENDFSDFLTKTFPEVFKKYFSSMFIIIVKGNYMIGNNRLSLDGDKNEN
jgi:hypothetical protein